ncbi:MAG: hypothetical protein DSY80_10195 [Desulfocapsa sp.]|nr:MAG: hypothetical protein DSY80_10195 [Desulfocapsa sp.]
MKKILVFVLLFAGIAGAALYVNHSLRLSNTTYYADYLPAETLATISLIDLNGLTDNFPSSPVGQLLEKKTMHSFLNQLGADPGQINSYDEVYDNVAGVMTNPAFRQVFGDDAVVALLAPDLFQLRDDPEAEILRSLLIFGTSAISGPVDSFSRLVGSKEISTVTVDGLDISRIQLDDEEMYGYAENGTLVLAWSTANIVTAVAQKKAGRSLRESASFVTAERFWSGFSSSRQYVQSYVNIARLQRLLAASKEHNAGETADFLQGFKGMESVLMQQGNELRMHSRVEYDFASLNEIFKRQYQSLAEKNLALSLLTRQALAYYWSCTLDREFIRESLSLKNEGQYRQLDAAVLKELGISLDKIIAAVGPQYGLVMNDIVNAGMFPLPKVIFFLQIRDHKIAQQLMDRVRKKIAERGFAAEQSLQVGKNVIYYWSILPNEATQPALVLTDNMLYIANGKSSLESLAAGNVSQDKLPADMADTLGPALVKNVEDGNYSTFIMRPARLADEGGDAVHWLIGMLAAEKGMSVGSLEAELLKAIRSIDVIAATSNFQKEHADSVLVITLKASTEQKKK